MVPVRPPNDRCIDTHQTPVRRNSATLGEVTQEKAAINPALVFLPKLVL
jgi:hypothetical protein